MLSVKQIVKKRNNTNIFTLIENVEEEQIIVIFFF